MKEVKKGKEFELELLMSTPIGKVRAFGIAKNKSRINESDVLDLFVRASQSKAMIPVLITTGKVSKKGFEKIKELNIKLVKIDGSESGIFDQKQGNLY